MSQKTYPEGHFVNYGLAIGIPLGLPLGLLFGDAAYMGIGIAIGAGVGLAIGSAAEARYKRNGQIEPLDPEVKRRRARILTITALAGAVVAAGLALYLVLR